MSNMNIERVLSVHHWNDTLFSFKTTRDHGTALRERPVRDDRPGERQRPPADARLLHRQPQLGRAPGVLQHQGARRPADLAPAAPPAGRRADDQHASPPAPWCSATCYPGKHLYLLGTGTGLAPFMSVIQDPETYERFDKVILVHGVRYAERTGLPRLHRQGPAAARVLRRDGARQADVLPGRDPRAVPQPGPPDRPDAQRQAVRGHRPAADQPAATTAP